MSSAEEPAEGVAAIGVWSRGAGEFVIRLTLSGSERDPDIRVVATADEAVEIVTEWFAGLGARAHT